MSTCLEPAGMSSHFYQSISLPITGCCDSWRFFVCVQTFTNTNSLKLDLSPSDSKKNCRWKISGVKWSVQSNYVLKDLEAYVYEKKKEPYFLGIFHFQKFILLKSRKYYVIQKNTYIVYSLQALSLYSLK